MSNYPPGISESTPDAPWNQDGPDVEHIADCLAAAKELEEMLEAEDCLNDCLPTIRQLIVELIAAHHKAEWGDT